MNTYSSDQIRHRVIELVKREFHFFPVSDFTDIYKLFYQDYFGPGHYLCDHQKIIEYIETELTQCQYKSGTVPYIHNISCLNNFLRIDLNWIIRGSISVAKMAELFYESSKGELYQPLPWGEYWLDICAILGAEKIDFNPYEYKLLSDLSKENMGIHHSKLYRFHYDPHYRIIKKELWQKVSG